jgi:hypothetical protein
MQFIPRTMDTNLVAHVSIEKFRGNILRISFARAIVNILIIVLSYYEVIYSYLNIYSITIIISTFLLLEKMPSTY